MIRKHIVYFWDDANGKNLAYISDLHCSFAKDFSDLVRSYGLPTRFLVKEGDQV